MDTRLCYNSTDRLYEVRLGLRVLSAHPTREGALLSQLGGEAPKALELAEALRTAHPILNDRVLKAVGLVADGSVQPTKQPNCFRVCSQKPANGKPQAVYEVDVDASTCTCPDWEERAPVVNGRKLCKHILAALFVRKLGVAAHKPPIRTEVKIHDRP